ncbi:O-antigen polymerase [Faecalibacillus intestinalis]|uniref:O-antigen polymerase n=1 Tax=Faecalibacillus intestinalis TaxID=1982626 RepID=UPI0022E3ECC1|nr:O-antigen polymerase [Faecalibacillus intestinalis]
MYWILTVLFMILTSIIGYYLEKKIGLLSCYGILWAIVTFLCGLNLYDLYPYSNKVYGIVCLGGLAITIGYILAYKIHVKRIKFTKIKNMEFNKTIIIGLLIFSLVFYFIQFIKVYKLMRSGIPLSIIRYSYYTQGKIMNDFETIISSWITTPIVYYLIIPINIWNYLNNKGKDKIVILILSLIDISLFLFVSQAKQNLIYYFLSFIISINQFGLNKDTKRKIYKIILLVCCIVFVLNGIRSGKFTLSFIYSYVGTSMSLLDNWTSYVQQNNLIGNGAAALYGIINIPLSILKVFHINSPQNIQEIGNNLSFMISKGVEVFKGVGPRNNVYVTNYLFFYYDARYWGVFIESLIYGLFIGYMTQIFKFDNKSTYMKACYNIIGVGFLYSCISWAFFNTAYCMSFILLRICCTHVKIKQ